MKESAREYVTRAIDSALESLADRKLTPEGQVIFLVSIFLQAVARSGGQGRGDRSLLYPACEELRNTGRIERDGFLLKIEFDDQARLAKVGLGVRRDEPEEMLH